MTAAPTSAVFFENQQVSFDLLRSRLESQPGRKRTLSIKADRLAPFHVKISRLAHGVPVGGELDYLDDGTLSAAMRQRTPF